MAKYLILDLLISSTTNENLFGYEQLKSIVGNTVGTHLSLYH